MTSSAPRTNSSHSAATSANRGWPAQELGRDAVHLQRAGIDFAVRAQVAMEHPARAPAIDDLDAADLDDAVPQLGLEAGGFGVEDDLTHGGGDGRKGLEDSG